MNFLRYELDLDKDEVVEVSLDKEANVRLLDEANYDNYKLGRKHRYYGGLARRSPLKITAPSAGRWFLVVDLGGYPGSVKASVRTFAPSR